MQIVALTGLISECKHTLIERVEVVLDGSPRCPAFKPMGGGLTYVCAPPGKLVLVSGKGEWVKVDDFAEFRRSLEGWLESRRDFAQFAVTGQAMVHHRVPHPHQVLPPGGEEWGEVPEKEIRSGFNVRIEREGEGGKSAAIRCGPHLAARVVRLRAFDLFLRRSSALVGAFDPGALAESIHGAWSGAFGPASWIPTDLRAVAELLPVDVAAVSAACG